MNKLSEFNKKVLNIEQGSSSVPLSQAHEEMCQFIDDDPEKFKLLLFPRGHLKSTLVTVGHSLRRICQNPKTRILIANATYNLACTFLEQIKSHLKGNETLKEFYGDFTENASKWNENQIKIYAPGETVDYEKKEPTVTAMGITGSLTSQHYDVVIIDDGVNRENITTLDQIQKVYRFYKDVLDLLEPGGELIVIGTRWHDIDLYGWIMNGDAERIPEIPKHISKELTSYPFYFKGNKFNVMKRMIVEYDKPIWPDKFTFKHIEDLKTEKGPYEFSSQYMNEPLPDEDQVFKKDLFRYFIDDDLKGRSLNRFTMVDPAISQESTADYTVIATIAIDEHKNWFVEEVIRKRLLPNEIIEEIFSAYMRWKPLEIGLEVVAYQKMLSYALKEEMTKRNRFLPLKELRPPTNKSKESRIKSLQPGYFSGKIFHKENMPNLEYLEDELLRFPRGSHDDIIDAIAYFTEFAVPSKGYIAKSKNQRHTYLY